MIGESIPELHVTNATDESIKSYEYDEYQRITGTQFNSAGQITIIIENQDQSNVLFFLVICTLTPTWNLGVDFQVVALSALSTC